MDGPTTSVGHEAGMEAELEELHADLQALVGRVLAERYRVDALLGAGGMGAVFRGYHLGLHRTIAIKVLHPELSRNDQVSKRFDREAHSASRLDHPNCVKVTDYGSTPEGMKYMIMQFLEGGELTDLLGEPMAPARAVEMITQVLRGLEHAHKHGIVHRDLKPENVFITSDHEGKQLLKLVDFGIAKIVSGEDARENMTRAGMAIGTPLYMSPEQAQGTTVDERTDLYAAGMMLYELMAGEHPFWSDDPVTIIRMQVMDTAPPLPRHVPRSLRDIVTKLIEKDPGDRYASATEVRNALDSVAPSLSMEVGDVSSPVHTIIGFRARVASAWSRIRERLPRSKSDVRTILTKAGRSGAQVRDASPRAQLAVFIGGATLAAAIVTCAMWPAQDTAVAGAGEGDGWGGWLGSADEQAAAGAASDVTSEDLAEVDLLLAHQDAVTALKVIQPLLDRHPDSAPLTWRRGKALAMTGKHQPALAAYGDAIQLDPWLLDDRDFFAELTALLAEPKLQGMAVDLALRHMGRHGHKFLAGQINQNEAPLGYTDRHRILVELERTPDSAALVDRQRNTALDLEQAQQSPTPCQTFSTALEQIAAEPHESYVKPVFAAKPPAPKRQNGKIVDPTDAPACEGLNERLAEVRELLRQKYGAPAGAGGPAKRADAKTANASGGGSKQGGAGDDGAKQSGTSQSSKGKGSGKKKGRGRNCNMFGAWVHKECRR